MPKLKPPSIEAAVFARSAQRQFSELRSAIGKLRDKNVSGAIKAPVPTGGSRYTKSTHTRPSVFFQAGEAALGHAVSGSFYQSAQQATSYLSGLFQDAARIL